MDKKKWYGRPRFYLSGSGQVKVAAFYEGNKTSGFIECELLLDQLRNSAPWIEGSCLPCNMATVRRILKFSMSYLTFQSLAGSLRTTEPNIQQLYVVPTQCILCFVRVAEQTAAFALHIIS
jgi:hypothetical protein